MRKIIATILIAALISACSETKYIFVTENENGEFQTTGVIVQDRDQKEPLLQFASLEEEDDEPISWQKVEELLIATGYLATLTVLLVLSAGGG